MKEYIVGLKSGVDYDAFWNEIETDGSGSTFVPDRAVGIVNDRSVMKRLCHYQLTDSEAEKLKNDPRVECVEIPPEQRDDIKIGRNTNYTYKYWKAYDNQATYAKNNFWNIPPYSVNWGLYRCDNNTNVAGQADPEYPVNWGYSATGAGVDFVIQDSGLQIDHPEFQDSNGVSRVQQIDWYVAAGIPGTMPPNFYTDYDGHGTHVAGTAAGRVYGWAKESKIYVMTIDGLCTYPTFGFDPTTSFDLIKRWHSNKPINPDTGAKRPTVVNMSWGYFSSMPYLQNLAGGVWRGQPWTFNYPGDDPNTIFVNYDYVGFSYGATVTSIDIAISECIDAGVFFCGAAGNNGLVVDKPGGIDYNNYFYTKTDSTPRYYFRGSTPGSSPGVLTVGSISIGYLVSLQETVSSFSVSGPGVAIWAPGENVISATSNVNRFGVTSSNSWYWWQNAQPADYYNRQDYRTCCLSGTSMASPQVAGVACQLYQIYPNFTPAQMYDKLISIASSGWILEATGYSPTNPAYNQTGRHGSPDRYLYQPFNQGNAAVASGAFTTQGNISIRT
jgi:subtilisin family serine protease